MKELIDSVKANDRVMEEVLGEPPRSIHATSIFWTRLAPSIEAVGNVLAPQLWLRYAPPQTLLLLMYKRSVGSRAVWVKDIPTYIAELDELEDVYFGRKEVRTQRTGKAARTVRIRLHLAPPKSPTAHVPHKPASVLGQGGPEGQGEGIRHPKTGRVRLPVDAKDQRFQERLEKAMNWGQGD